MDIQVSTFMGERELCARYNPDETEYGEYSICTLEFEGKPGEFRYNWLFQYLSREEIAAMRDMLSRMLEIVPATDGGEK